MLYNIILRIIRYIRNQISDKYNSHSNFELGEHNNSLNIITQVNIG